MSKMKSNALCYGDNLKWMRQHMRGGNSIDLIYLDPPFNSKANYNLLHRNADGSNSQAQVEAFKDTWQWDTPARDLFTNDVMVNSPEKVKTLMQTYFTCLGPCDLMAYLTMMCPRLLEMHRLLAPTGSLYLHCDPTASHYLKVLMDVIFDGKNFRNEIVWHYNTRTMPTSWYAKKHDILLFYTKTDEYTFNTDEVRIPYHPDSLKQYNKIDEHGRKYKQQSGGLRTYLDTKGQNCHDVWNIQILGSRDKERLGYPTQKPEKLLERIIKASSNPGDIVFDPFCGCGTSINVAERLGRQWVGIDVTHLAIDLIEYRLTKTFGSNLKPYVVKGRPDTMEGVQALKRDRSEFRYWAINYVGGTPETLVNTKAKDITGFKRFFVPNVEFPENIHIVAYPFAVAKSNVKDLWYDINNDHKSAIGVIISLDEPKSDALDEAAVQGNYIVEINGETYRYPKIQILTVERLLAGEKIKHPSFENGVLKI